MKGLPEERVAANRFTSDVDALQAGLPPIGTPDAARQADLETARLLQQNRFAPSRSFEFRLRNQLLDQLGKKEAKSMSWSRFFRAAARPALVTALAVVLLFGGALAVSPEVRASAGGWVARFVEVASPAGLLSRQAAPTQDGPTGARSLLDRRGEQPLATGLPEPVAEAKLDSAQNIVSLETAQAGVNFQIRVPGWLPAGYKLLGAAGQPSLEGIGIAAPALPKLPADAPQIELPQSVILVFSNATGGKLMLSERRIVPLSSREAPREAELPAGTGSIKEVTVNGQAAQYIEGAWTEKGWVDNGERQLHWQDAEGVLYDLSSSNLGFEELLSVAESIK